jgi:hypothetical protein
MSNYFSCSAITPIRVGSLCSSLAIRTASLTFDKSKLYVIFETNKRNCQKVLKNPKIAQNSLKIALFNALFNSLLTDGGGLK